MRHQHLIALFAAPLLSNCGGGWTCTENCGGQNSNSYYVTGRYYCSDRSECDKTVWANSCRTALNELNRDVNSRDVCVYCNPNILDHTRSWTGRSERIDGGPCANFSLNGKAELQLSQGLNELGSRNFQYSRIPFGLAATLSHVMRVASTPPANNDPDTCKQVCDARSPYCLRVSIGSSEQEGLRRLQQALLANPSSIKKADIMAMFGQGSDECERDDVSLAGGLVTNSSKNPGFCNLTTELPNSSLAIQLPQTMHGEYRRSRSRVVAVFTDPATRARLFLSDQQLNSDWGGDIVAAYSEGDYVGFSVGTNSCLRASLR
jgi:hypothetical protein